MALAAESVAAPLKPIAPAEFSVQLSLVVLEAASVRALPAPVVLILTAWVDPAAVLTCPRSKDPAADK